MEIVWLELAKLDLEDIRIFYNNKAGVKITNNLLRKIVNSANILLEYPYIGIQTSMDNVLEWNISKTPYILPYRLKNKQIQILRVFHTSQNRPDFWT